MPGGRRSHGPTPWDASPPRCMTDHAGGRGVGKRWGAGVVLLLAAPLVLWWVVTGYVAPRPVAGPFDTYAQCAAVSFTIPRVCACGARAPRRPDAGINRHGW